MDVVLYLDAKDIESNMFSKVDMFLREFASWEAKARSSLLQDFLDGGETYHHLAWYLKIIKGEHPDDYVHVNLDDGHEAVSNFYLKTVSIFLEKEEKTSQIVFDYSVNTKILDHIMVVYFYLDGSILRICEES